MVRPNLFSTGSWILALILWICIRGYVAGPSTVYENCPLGQYPCKDGCISLGKICLSAVHCPWGRLMDCPMPCVGDMFQCNNNGHDCIDKERRCDGIRDCKDGSDEVGCDVPVCTYGICDQLCSRTLQSYRCSCVDGYVLHENGRTCKAAGPTAVLVCATIHDIREMSINGPTTPKVIVKNLQYSTGFYVNGDHIYWTDIYKNKEAIYSSYMNGADKQTVVSLGLERPMDLTIDYLTGNIYFTDIARKLVAVCTASGSACSTLIQGKVDTPHRIALSVERSLMLWTDWGDEPRIMRAGMDGSNPTPVITEDIHGPTGIAVDDVEKRMYWTDWKTRRIESSTFDGVDRRVIYSEESKYPYSVSVFEDTVYWSYAHEWKVVACNKFTGSDYRIVANSSNGHIHSQHVFHPVMQTRTNNPCSEDRCESMCLLAPGNTYKCACPVDKKLSADLHSCEDKLSDRYLLASNGEKLVRVRLPYLGNAPLLELNVSGISNFGSMAYNPLTGRLFVSNPFENKIYVVNMTTLKVQLFATHELESVGEIDFDYVANNLYVCNPKEKSVHVFSLDTNSSVVLLNYTDKIPISLALAPEEGFMFVAFEIEGQDTMMSMHKISMDGSTDKRIIQIESRINFSITYVPDGRRLCWTGTRRNCYHSLHIHVNTTTITCHITTPAYFASMDNLYWTTHEDSGLHSDNVHQKKMEIGHKDMRLVAVKPLYNGSDARPRVHCGCSHVCLLAGASTVCACPDGMSLSSDNVTCASHGACQEGEKRCQHDGTCILNFMWCDKLNDCPDAEDERNCNYTCNDELEFKCRSGECISVMGVCNGVPHCQDGSDEECEESLSYLVLTSDYILSVSPDISKHKIEQIVNVSGTTSMDLDNERNQLYWNEWYMGTENLTRVYRMDLTSGSVVHLSGLTLLGPLAVEWITGNLYLADNSDTSYKYIKVCDFDHGRCASIAKIKTDSIMTITVAVDPISSYVFWAMNGNWMRHSANNQIFRSRLTGADQTVIVDKNLQKVDGMALDESTRTVYWADDLLGEIGSVGYNGEGWRVLKSGVHPYSSLSLFEGNLYWYSRASDSITIFNLHKENIKELQVSVNGTAAFILRHTSRQPTGANPCLNVTCEHMCVLGPNGMAQCICPEGQLVDSNKTCPTLQMNNTSDVFVWETPLLEPKRSETNWSLVVPIIIGSVFLFSMTSVAVFYVYKRRCQNVRINW